MTIDADFVEKIENIVNKAAEPFFHVEHGINHTNKSFKALYPPAADSLKVSTLTAVATYCQNLVEDGQKYTIQILNHRTVKLLSNLDGTYRTREFFLEAVTVQEAFSFGHDTRITEFIVSLQAMFVQDKNTSEILHGVGNMSADSKVVNKDDGVSQVVEARVGVAQAPENVKLPNPVSLRPFRTFPEIEQPASNFVIRVKHDERHGFLVALHEADGGAWKVEAIAKIKEWFETALAELVKAGTVTVLG